jgi:hypothetical protein
MCIATVFPSMRKYDHFFGTKILLTTREAEYVVVVIQTISALTPITETRDAIIF